MTKDEWVEHAKRSLHKVAAHIAQTQHQHYGAHEKVSHIHDLYDDIACICDLHVRLSNHKRSKQSD